MEIAFHHVAVSVRDMDRMLAFYRDILGFQVEWDMDRRSGEALSRVVGLPDVTVRIAMLNGYGTRIELFQYHEPQGRGDPARRQCDFGLTHLAFHVRNIRALYERLAAAGVASHSPPQAVRPGVWAVYMKDPEGNVLELVEYGKDDGKGSV